MSDIPRPTGVNWESADRTYGQVQFGNDSGTIAMFYTRAVLNESKSREANRPIYENHTYVKIQQPGERLNIVDRPVKDEDKRRWGGQWNDYVNGRLQVPDGTPVEILFSNHPAIAENLKGSNVFTIEQLAKLTESAMDSIGMGARDWVNKAQAYIDSADKGKNFARMSHDLENEKANNRIMKQQLDQALAQLRALEAKIADPVRNSFNPGHVQGVDIQSERINANRQSTIDQQYIASPGDIKQAKLEEKMKDPYAINTGGDEF